MRERELLAYDLRPIRARYDISHIPPFLCLLLRIVVF
jgi:hypothetical protein